MGVTTTMTNMHVATPDKLPAEQLKFDHTYFILCFHHVRVGVWTTRETFQQWEYATIRALHKKRDRSDYSNRSANSPVTHAS